MSSVRSDVYTDTYLENARLEYQSRERFQSYYTHRHAQTFQNMFTIIVSVGMLIVAAYYTGQIHTLSNFRFGALIATFFIGSFGIIYSVIKQIKHIEYIHNKLSTMTAFERDRLEDSLYGLMPPSIRRALAAHKV